ncbi:MAG: hypothetical protein ACRDPK_07340 [Carbonactinosporaceae bacterium]
MQPDIHIARGVRPAEGLPPRAPAAPVPPVRAVLFDFAHTLFRPVSATTWLRGALTASGREAGDATVTRLAQALDDAWALPQVVEAQEGRDTSEEAHRRARLTWIRVVEELEPVAELLSERVTAAESYQPFDDTPRVLADLARRRAGAWPGRGARPPRDCLTPSRAEVEPWPAVPPALSTRPHRVSWSVTHARTTTPLSARSP